MSDRSKREVLKDTSKQEILLDAERASECFELYFQMGIDRTLESLQKKTGVPYEVLSEWNEAFGWQELIRKRNEDQERIFEERYLSRSRDIRNRIIHQMENLLGDMENNSLGLPFVIKDVNDFRSLSQAYESLARANSLAIKKSQDVLSSDSAPTTWADLLHSVEGDGVERE